MSIRLGGRGLRQHRHETDRVKRKNLETLKGKVSVAIMFTIFFSYQKLASSTFAVVYCVPLEEEKVFFLDGTVKCVQNWQVVTLFCIFLCIVPFGFYISFSYT